MWSGGRRRRELRRANLVDGGWSVSENGEIAVVGVGDEE